ncbi:MAG TPA: aldolase/citrate lyase family protein [Acidimicrobiales bacterium]|nr:aldolase/citrate lyase family protein [Acidimicrobiales bacterium]
MTADNDQRSSSPYASAAAKDDAAPPGDLRAKLRRGEVTLGAWCGIPSSFSVELFSAMDFDWICVDTQHGLVSYSDMVSMLQAAFAHRMPALVRVAANRPELIMGALDAGATGVVVPLVNSAEEAARAAEACRYPPVGNRSWGPARAALQRSSYTPEEVNGTTICVVMIENPPAVKVASEILAVPGVDAVYIGPWDLSLSTHGKAPQPGGSEEDSRAIESVRKAAVSNGVAPGIACGGFSHVKRWVEAGFKLIAVNSDVGIVNEAAARLLRESRELVRSLPANDVVRGDGSDKTPSSRATKGEPSR